MISLYPPLFEGKNFPLASSGELGGVGDGGRMSACMVRQTPLLKAVAHAAATAVLAAALFPHTAALFHRAALAGKETARRGGGREGGRCPAEPARVCID